MLGIGIGMSSTGTPSLPSVVSSILRKFGSDAHLYMPGPGVPILGPEIVDFSTLSAGAGITITPATRSVSFNGSQPDWGGLVTTIQLNPLKSYLLSYTISRTSGMVKVTVGPEGYDNASGNYTKTQVGTGYFNVQSYSSPEKFVGTVSNISIKEILGYTNYLNGFAAGNYIESTGNTNAAVDSAVGLVLDAAGSVGAELVANPDFSAGYWYKNGVTVTGTNVLGFPAVGNEVSILSSGESSANKMYAVTAKLSGNGTISLGVTNNVDQAVRPSVSLTSTPTDFTVYCQMNGTAATNASVHLRRATGDTATTVTAHSLSWKRVTGTHATQATTANKPILRRGIVNLQPYANVSSGLSSVPYGGGSSGAASTPVVTPNYAADPFGGNTACRVQFNLNGGTATGDRAYLTGQPIAIGNVVRTSAVWVKANSGTATILTRINGTSAYVTVDTSEWKLLVVSGASAGDSTHNLVEIRGGQTPTNSNTADLLVATHGIFQGVLTAQQILAAGGIPLTTTAPASSQYGIGEPVLGPELVTNGDFSNSSSWANPPNWSISGGLLTATGAANYTSSNQSIAVTAGKQYMVTYTLMLSAGSARAYFTGGTNAVGIERTASGTYSEQITANAGNNMLCLSSAGLGFTGSFDNVSVKEITGYKSLPNSFAWQFDGSNDALNVGLQTQASGALIGVAIPNTSGWMSIAGSGGQVTATPGVSIGFTGSSQARLLFGDATSANGDIKSTGVTIAPGAPYVVAGRWSPTLKEIWVNGVQRGTIGSTAVVTSGNTFTIGRISPTETDLMNGNVFAVIEINGTLSDADFKTLQEWAGSIAGVPIA